MSGSESWPIWGIVGLCGLVNQSVKLLAYSLGRRRFWPAVLGQAGGLPSLPAAVLSCLVVVVGFRLGWHSAEVGFSLVLAVIVVHDAMKLGFLVRRQQEAVLQLVTALDHRGAIGKRAAEYLDPRTHQPVHVVAGVVLGGLFALAFGLQPR